MRAHVTRALPALHSRASAQWALPALLHKGAYARAARPHHTKEHHSLPVRAGIDRTVKRPAMPPLTHHGCYDEPSKERRCHTHINELKRKRGSAGTPKCTRRSRPKYGGHAQKYGGHALNCLPLSLLSVCSLFGLLPLVLSRQLFRAPTETICLLFGYHLPKRSAHGLMAQLFANHVCGVELSVELLAQLLDGPSCLAISKPIMFVVCV